MKSKVMAALLLMMILPALVVAQSSLTDAQELNLKGNVRTVLTTARGAHGQIVGHPDRMEFNADGNYSTVTHYDTSGNPTVIVRYHYSKKGVLERDVRTFEPFSVLLAQTTYSYDKKNHTMTVLMQNEQDSLSNKTVYTYDNNGNLLSVVNYDEKDQQLSAVTHKLGSNNRPAETIFTEGPESVYRSTERYRYDTDGNKVECRVYNLNSLRQAFFYGYDFDEYGNWVTCWVYHVNRDSSELFQVITREIVYF